MEPEEGQGVPQGGSTGNPAWNDFLSVVPQELHSQVTPVLEKWDKGVQDNFVSKKVHSDYEPYKPFVEQKIAPDQLNEAYQIYTALQSNPQEFKSMLEEWLGVEESGSGQQGPPSNPGSQEQGQGSPDFSQAPEFQQLNQTVQQLAQYVVAQQSQAEQNKADEEFEQEIAAKETELGRQFSDPELKFIVGTMLAGANLDDAVNALGEINPQSKPKPPSLLGSGGNFPQQNGFDPRKLDEKGRKQAIVDYLASVKSQG